MAAGKPEAGRDIDPHLLKARALGQFQRARPGRDRHRGIERRRLDAHMCGVRTREHADVVGGLQRPHRFQRRFPRAVDPVERPQCRRERHQRPTAADRIA